MTKRPQSQMSNKMCFDNSISMRKWQKENTKAACTSFLKCRLLFRVRLADKGFGVKISSFGKAKSGTGYLLTYMEL